MASIPCRYAVNCEGADFPITNYSAESGEQVPTYTSLVFPDSWDKQGCLSLCVSTVSQNEADLCALSQAAACQPPFVFDPPEPEDPDDPGGGGGTIITPFFFNSIQDCTINCDDTTFTYTVPAGTFSASTQAAADARANAYACLKATENLFCLGPLTNDGACAGTAYTGVVGITSNQGVLTASISDGELPPGMSLSFTVQSFTISGVSIVPGQYDFTVQVIDNAGNTAQRSYTIYVIEIAQDTLPNGTVGNAYSQTLTAGGPTLGVVTWAVTSGFLPPGLSLNSSTGQITGIPTSQGTANFTISMTDER